MNWFADHTYVAQWTIAIGGLGALLVALFGSRFWDWYSRPQLTIEFRPSAPFIRRAHLHESNGHGREGPMEAEWARVLIRNNGRSVASECVVILAGVRSNGDSRPDIDPVQLRLAGVPRERGFEPFRVAPRTFAYANVFSQRPDQPGIHLETTPGVDFGFETVLSPCDPHELFILVTAANADPAELVVPVAPAVAVSPEGEEIPSRRGA